jgi:hypothetical protein
MTVWILSLGEPGCEAYILGVFKQRPSDKEVEATLYDADWKKEDGDTWIHGTDRVHIEEWDVT